MTDITEEISELTDRLRHRWRIQPDDLNVAADLLDTLQRSVSDLAARCGDIIVLPDGSLARITETVS